MTVETVLPQWVVIILAMGVGMGLGGLGILVGCSAVEKLVRLIRRTLAANLRLQRMRRLNELAALNFWIREYFRKKKELAAQGDAQKDLAELRSFLSDVGLNELPGQAGAGRRIRHAE